MWLWLFIKDKRTWSSECLQVIKIYSYALKLFAKKFPVVNSETAKMLFENKVYELMVIALELQLNGNEIQSTIIYQKINGDTEVC